MKVTIEVDKQEAKRIAEELTKLLGKKVSIKKAATLFVQDLIDRYFSMEYLDAEKLELK